MVFNGRRNTLIDFLNLLVHSGKIKLLSKVFNDRRNIPIALLDLLVQFAKINAIIEGF